MLTEEHVKRRQRKAHVETYEIGRRPVRLPFTPSKWHFVHDPGVAGLQGCGLEHVTGLLDRRKPSIVESTPTVT